MNETGDAFATDVHGWHCDGCLDSRKCWVCLGTGRVEDRFGGSSDCPACAGSGICPKCLPSADDLRGPGAGLRSIPRPRSASTG